MKILVTGSEGGIVIPISKCPNCGSRSDSHPVIGTFDGGLIRECPCGGKYDSGILGGIEIEGSSHRK